MATPIKVLSINGWCRNGSTIIGNLLNEVDGFFHVGELHFLWKNAYGHGSNTKCGCGLDLVRCPIWSRVLERERPADRTAEDHAREVWARQAKHIRTRFTWQVLRRGLATDERRAHAEIMARTYRAIVDTTGCKVIVDSTKIPGEAALLDHVDGVEPYYVHLVRDPRAVAHSWMRQKDYAYTISALRSTAYWVTFNLASRALTSHHPARSIFLRYEDFIREPAATLRQLVELVGEAAPRLPLRGRVAELRPNHTVTGNPDRFRSGPTVIRPDDSKWKTELPARDKLTTVAVAWPLMWQYGYALTTGDAPVSAGTEPSSLEDHRGSRSAG
ncbi:MAG TPA: sulfotransferase [Kofleriaceae bacterium]|nr:sulfotransferase [Kofleriaceae bacterium]